MSPSIPETVGRYKIIAELGRGGMSTVYSAHDPMFTRDVAIKILPRELLHDPMFRARFEREAQTIATLEHPAILPVYDYGEADGQPFFVMRLMTGGSLADRLNQGPLPLEEAARVITIIAGALDEAHRRGIVHRDLKPGNILFDQHNDPFLADFGIAKLSEAGATLTGNVIVGTPAYMSPEQGRGEKDIDGRSDVYSLGVILFEMLTGRIPFQADTPMGQIIKHMNSPIPEILTYQPELPPDIQVVVNRAMHKRKFGRFNTAGEMAQALRAVAAGKPVPVHQAMPTYATLPGAEPSPLPNGSAPFQKNIQGKKEETTPEVTRQKTPNDRSASTPQAKKKIHWFWRLLRTVALVLLSLVLFNSPGGSRFSNRCFPRISRQLLYTAHPRRHGRSSCGEQILHAQAILYASFFTNENALSIRRLPCQPHDPLPHQSKRQPHLLLQPLCRSVFIRSKIAWAFHRQMRRSRLRILIRLKR